MSANQTTANTSSPEKKTKYPSCLRCKRDTLVKKPDGIFECTYCGTAQGYCNRCKKFLDLHNTIYGWLSLIEGNLVPRSQKRNFVCNACITKYSFGRCTNCNLYVEKSKLVNLEGYNGGRLCPTCANNLAVCHACRAVISKTALHSGTNYCTTCYNLKTLLPQLGINAAHYRPVPVFFGKEPPHYGIELEVDTSEQDATTGDYARFLVSMCVTELNKLIKTHGAFYMKSDGSLAAGFEIVSHPHSLSAWEEQTWLQKTCEIVKEHHGSSFNTRTCGVHVHRSRGDLTDLQMTMLVVLFVRLQPFFERIAQRKENGYCHYAFFKDEKGGYGKLNGNVVYKAVKEKCGSVINRYQALNITIPSTIECRIFKGTLCYGSILAYIKFVHWLCEFVKHKETVLGKLLRYSVGDLWNMLAEFFTIDPILTAYLQEKKVLLKGTKASQRVLDAGYFGSGESASSLFETSTSSTNDA